MRRNFTWHLISCLMILSGVVSSQTIDELLELNRENLSNLYEMRGIPDNWMTNGKVTKEDLKGTLREYYGNVGLLYYGFENDTLRIVFMDNKRTILQVKHSIKKDSLISQVYKANAWLTHRKSQHESTLRGAIDLSDEDELNAERISFENLNAILLPFQKELSALNHLIIIPALNIAILPFAAMKIDNDRYLIDQMSYSLAPSAVEVMLYSQMKENAGISLGGYHSYSFNNALFIANPLFPSNKKLNFSNLPGTEIEVKNITETLNPGEYTVLIGQEATVKNVMTNICDRDLLYFATHGVSNSLHPLDSSFLVLAKAHSGSFLSAKQIQEIRATCRLKATLVILSACETGLGKEHEGGIIGLSRAFQIAGAHHTLMSLWSINDNETAIIMSSFFSYLKIGGDFMPHEALRQAILKYRTEVADDPYYWAAFSIFGIPD